MLTCDDFSKNVTSYSKNFYCFFESFKLLDMCAKLKSLNNIPQSKKEYDGDNFTSILQKQLQGQNTFMGIGLIELIEPSYTLNYRLLFKHCILQIFCSKN